MLDVDVSEVPVPKLMTVTPQMAAEWLEDSSQVENKSNRPLNRAQVNRLKRHILEGTWIPYINGRVFIGRDGFVHNGQHTLNAVKESDIPIEVEVGFNAPDWMIDYLDTDTKPRSASDALGAKMIKDTSIKAAAIRAHYAYSVNRPQAFSSPSLTNRDINEYYQKHPGLDIFVSKAYSLSRNPKIKPGLALALLYESDPNNEYPEVMEQWFDGLQGIGNYHGDPRKALRDKIERKIKAKTTRSLAEEAIEYIKCWRAWVSGLEMSNVTVGKVEAKSIPRILPAADKTLD